MPQPQQYTLTLTHTTYGASAANPDTVATRQARAARVARGLNVQVINPPTSTTSPFTWVVYGDPDDICDMLAIWLRWNNVTLTAAVPQLNCITPGTK